MKLTLKQAAEAVGKSKPTILRAIQNHKLSAAQDELTRSWMIDPAELYRVYPPVTNATMRNGEETTLNAPTRNNYEPNSSEMNALRRELEALRQEREREREQLQQHIADLRRRLDQESEERRQLSAILTDQRQPRRSLWARLVGK
jgi:septal ring factor EnvC (AmiA/AmiB activator)